MEATRTHLNLGLWLAVFICVPVLAGAQSTPNSNDVPTVILLRVTNSPPARALEQQFAEQLKLELDGLEIEQIELRKSNFSSLVLKDKLARIEDIMSQRDILAAVWIEQGKEGNILLHMVALSANSAFVRVISTPAGPDSAEELAFSAQVLLSQTYSLASTGEKQRFDRSLGTLVQSVSIELEEKTEKLDQFRFGVMPLFQMNLADPRSFALLGGGLLLEAQFWRALFVRLFVAGQNGPFVKTDAGEVSGWTLQAGLALGYTWTLGHLRLGPVAAIAPYRYALQINLNEGGEVELTRWDFVGSLGLDLRVVLTRHLEIVLDTALGLHGHTRDISLENGTTLLSIPRFDAQVALGILIAY